MTRAEKNELLVKFACAALAALGDAPVTQCAVVAFNVADAMLAEYIKRQPAAPAPAPDPVIDAAEVKRVAAGLTKLRADLDAGF
jgi:hypothetical protein